MVWGLPAPPSSVLRQAVGEPERFIDTFCRADLTPETFFNELGRYGRMPKEFDWDMRRWVMLGCFMIEGNNQHILLCRLHLQADPMFHRHCRHW